MRKASLEIASDASGVSLAELRKLEPLLGSLFNIPELAACLNSSLDKATASEESFGSSYSDSFSFSFDRDLVWSLKGKIERFDGFS